ncbi:MAG: helical backbone metal receptor, partial [Mariprofundaceae bacterium]
VALDPALPGLETLKHAGARVVGSDPQSVADVFADIRRIGRASGHSVAAGKLAEQLEKQLQKMRGLQRMQGLSVFYEIWDQPLMAVGGVGFLADVIRQAGLTNIFAGVGQEGLRINPESVVRAAPQLIIVTGKGDVVAKRRAYWRKWLPGVQVLAVDANLMHRPGPRIVDAIGMLTQQVRSLKAGAMAR